VLLGCYWGAKLTGLLTNYRGLGGVKRGILYFEVPAVGGKMVMVGGF